MKQLYILSIFLLAVFSSCEKEEDNQLDILATMPGEHLHEMEIDANNNFFFVTSEIDNSIEIPDWVSYLPSRFYLSKKQSENGNFEILDNEFIGIEEILFDKENNLWARNAKTVFLRKQQEMVKILELPIDNGLFHFFAVDNDNNIWAGGLQTGLYKIDSELNITEYNMENSSIPTNSMTNIHIDKSNNVWLALWNGNGVLKINSDSWVNFNSDNSNITYQNIWCLTTDKDDNLWIGTGWSNNNQSLMKFNGHTWEYVTVKNERNETITGTIRKLYSDKNRIYLVSELTDNSAFSSNKLLTFDGTDWKEVKSIPEDDGIADLKFDDYRKVVWVRTLNQGLFQIDM